MSGYTKNINRHSDIYITDRWQESSEEHTLTKPSSSIYIEAHKDNQDDLLLKINDKAELIPIVAGGDRSIDSYAIYKAQVINASATNKYHLELYLD